MINIDVYHGTAVVNCLPAQAPSVACRWTHPIPSTSSSSSHGSGVALSVQQSRSSEAHFLAEDVIGSATHPSLYLSGGALRERQIIEGVANSVTSGWKRNLFNTASLVDVDDLSATIEGVYNTISLFGPGWLDLAGLDVDLIQGEHLAAILRATVPWKEYVRGWDEALSISEIALKRSGVDPEDALFGLI